MILVTGAAGFIGSVIIGRLNKMGETDIIACDSFKTTDKWKNLLGLKFKEFVDHNSLFEYLHSSPNADKITAIIHMGACSATTEKNVDFLYHNNTLFSEMLCEWAIENDVRFVYASSAATYGDGELGFSDSDELTPKLKPLNAYGFSKWLFDMWVLQNKLQDKVAGVRFYNVFGPNEYYKGEMASVVFKAFPEVKKNKKIRLFKSHKEGFNDGEQLRDFVYVDQAVDAVMFLLKNKKANGIFNVGTGFAHSFNDLAKGIFEALKIPFEVEYIDMPEDLRGRYQYYTKADTSKLESYGFSPGPDKFHEYVVKYCKEYLLHNKNYSEV